VRRTFDKSAFWFLVAIAAVLVGLCCGRIDLAPAHAESVPSGIGGTGLITHFHDDRESGLSRVIVVDPLQRRMAVYHVELNSGKIQLKSVRNLTIDLQVEDYNSGDPSPIDMKKLLQRN